MRKNTRHARQLARKKHARTFTKRTHTRLASWLQNAFLAGCFLIALGAFTFFALPSAFAQPTPPLSAAKQQLVQSQAQWHANVDKKKAPKGKVSLGSCPVNLQQAPAITVLTPVQMATMHDAYASFASVISAEHRPYFIYGENGKFVVQPLPLDPCKANLFQAQRNKQTFLSPALNPGNLLIQSVQGDLITYRTSAGATGAFNYVTGQFL